MTFFEMTLITLMMINSFAIFMYSSPLTLMLTVIVQTLLICVLLKVLMNTSWFSMLLFLVFIGGLLILFTYISSLVSNEQLTVMNKNNISNSIYLIILSSMMLMALMLMFKPSTPFVFTNSYHISLEYFIFKVYSPMLSPIIFMMGLYLLLVLLVSVYIVMVKSSSLRSTTQKL